jgi:predicted aspartyl protease
MNYEEIKKRQLVQNAQNIGMVDTGFEELVSDKPFIETFNFLRSHAIRHDQQNEEKSKIQIHNIYQSLDTGTIKKDKIKTGLELINELQV